MRPSTARGVARELQLIGSDTTNVRFHGDSMRPFLEDGDRVIVAPVTWDEIRLGDLVTYRFEDKFPTRRVVHKSRASLLTWCDNWPTLRFRVARAQVLGRAVARERDGVCVRRGAPEWEAATDRAFAIFRRSRLRRGLKRVALAVGRLLPRRRPGAAPVDAPP